MRAALTLALIVSSSAIAQSQQPEAKKAESLFIQGRDALARKEYPLACAKFRESLNLVSRPSTLLNLAQCEESLGKLVSAMGHWKEGSMRLESGDDRFRIAMERIDSLGRRIPTLKLKAGPKLDPSARVMLDDALVDPALMGTAMSLDPGVHTVVIQVAGKPDLKQFVRLEEGKPREIELGAEGPEADASSHRSGAPGESNGGKSAPNGAAGSSGRRTAAWVAGGVGAAGLATALVTGGILLSKNATIQDNCPDKKCNPTGRDAIDSANTLTTVNWIGWGVGALGAGIATWLFLSGPDDGPKVTTAFAPTVLPGGFALTMDKRF
ncbi:MAG: hypothetical protein HY898_09205 [Deltaproteobacteria bacterium]|nr:hypothetical protein [Deltaproteobacteria bacterium]